MQASGVVEMQVRRGDLRLTLRRDPRAAIFHRGPVPTGQQPAGADERLHAIAAPLTGVFYAASGLTARPFAAVGDWVERDAVVGLIETMKVFNEVTADCRGRVAAILAQQGQLVHTGEPLLLVDSTAAPEHSGEVTP